MLISALTKQGGEIRSFGSAKDSVYAQFGSVAVSDFAENAWRIVIRSGEKDLVKEKYGQLPDAELEKLLQKDLHENIMSLLIGLKMCIDQKTLKTAAYAA